MKRGIFKTTTSKFGPCIIRHIRADRDGMVDAAKLRKTSTPVQYKFPRG